MELLRTINQSLVEREKRHLDWIPVRYLASREHQEIKQINYYDQYRNLFLKSSAGVTIIGGVFFMATGVPIMLFALPQILQGALLETWRAHATIRLQAIQELQRELESGRVWG